MKNALRLVAVLLLACMCVSVLAACGKSNNGTTKGDEPGPSSGVYVPYDPNKSYTYKDAVVQLSSNWNPHTYQTSDESYPVDFITAGLYSFVFNDALHPVEGKDPYSGYAIVPEMAASLPVDVTTEIRAQYPKFNIPESATEGYAYTIDLNPNATWENGEKITADDYVWSMQQLLTPKYLNYRATDYFAGALCIANAENFYYQGTTAYKENSTAGAYSVEDLVKNADGVYCTPDGNKMYIAIGYGLDNWLGGNSLYAYVSHYGEEAFGNLENFATLVSMCDDNGLVPLTDETNALLSSVTTSNPNWGETDADLFNYYIESVEYAPDFSADNIGVFKSGEYQITVVLGKSLTGFNLLYNLSGNWIVYRPYYENSWTYQEGAEGEEGIWTTNYCTSLETTMSYGPYKMTQFQTDKSMRFEKNENWYGYTDGKHVFVDPVDGNTYSMYQTTAIDTQVVAEASTRKLMFLSGQLMGYGLQAEDFDAYRGSEYCYATPGSTIYFFIFNGYKAAIDEREAAADFDTTKYDLQTMTLTSFRKAVAVTYDKDLFASTISPARSGAFGLIGDAYIYDPATGARYRDTDQAKLALCEFYSVDPADFGGDLDKAVDSITGYDPEKAKELYNEAFEEALKAGFITSADGKHADQELVIEYCSSAPSDFITKTLDYLNEKLAEVTNGTAWEGKIKFEESAPYGNNWSNMIKSGMSDTVLGGWNGSLMDPFGLTDLYTNPSYQYDAKWFNATAVVKTMEIEGEEITLNLKQWSDALNGATVKDADGKEHCFGEGIVDVEVRLNILAMIEAEVLSTYNYIPMLLDGGMSLLSKQVFYVVEEYNAVLGRGGITYMRYNYDDVAWAAYVEENGGQIAY